MDRTQRLAAKFLEDLEAELGSGEVNFLKTMTEFAKAVETVYFAMSRALSLPPATARSLVEAVGIQLEANLQKVNGVVDEGDTFLSLYISICKAHGKYIGSCGCCNSPWVHKVEEEDRAYDDMAGHEAHLRGLQCTPCKNSGAYVKARYAEDGVTLLCAECGEGMTE
jgi:hypothetical protein